jgi:DNA invertase Pin-like site-specific DNA recombinase
MDTTTPAGRAFLQIQAAFAEMERNLIRQRVNRDRGVSRETTPPTPPGIRVRTTAVRRIKRPQASPWEASPDE